MQLTEGQRITLASSSSRQRVSLNWVTPPRKPGFWGWLGVGKVKIDLGLGCMYRLTTGEKGVIQLLGDSFGSESKSPFVLLDQGNPDGTAKNGVSMTIFKPEIIETLALFVIVYEGSALPSRVHAQVTVKGETGEELLVTLDSPGTGPLRSVALLERRAGGLGIIKEDRDFAGHASFDEHYGFGFQWGPRRPKGRGA